MREIVHSYLQLVSFCRSNVISVTCACERLHNTRTLVDIFCHTTDARISGVTRLQWARVQVFQKGPLFPQKTLKKQRRANFGPPQRWARVHCTPCTPYCYATGKNDLNLCHQTRSLHGLQIYQNCFFSNLRIIELRPDRRSLRTVLPRHPIAAFTGGYSRGECGGAVPPFPKLFPQIFFGEHCIPK